MALAPTTLSTSPPRPSSSMGNTRRATPWLRHANSSAWQNENQIGGRVKDFEPATNSETTDFMKPLNYKMQTCCLMGRWRRFRKYLTFFNRASGFPALILSMLLFLTESARAQSGPGSALFIAGTVNYVAVPHTAAFNSLPITVMAWVNTIQTTGQQGLVNKYAANSLNGWNLFLLNGHVRAWYFVSSTRNVYGGGDGLDGGFIADGTWHHIALVVDSSGASLYVDGINQFSRLWTGAFGAATTTQEVRIGSYPGGNNGFIGSIFLDDVSVWNVNLSFGQIQTSRNGGLTGLEGSRLAYYRCDEGSGATIADSAPLGGSNNGTWVGVSLFVPVLPSVQTLPASAVGFTQATLNGIANPNRSTIAAGFQWGTTTNFGNVSVATTFGGAGATSDQGFS